nr:transglutaminase domain-containing protein [Lachnospiraceae bacterium]
MFHKKKTAPQQKPTYPYGFSFGSKPLTRCSDRILLCALKGIFIFAAVYGTLGGLISSFSLPCYPYAIALILLFLSLSLAFLHYNRLIFNVCYPIVFLIFTYSIFTYRYHVYSGFQAFLNILQEQYSTYFDLSILREAAEYFSDRNMTITIATVFIGFFLIVLLNIAISEYMNLPLVILLTFPIFQLGIYIEQTPDFPYLVLLLFSYFMIAILKRSGHFLLPYREKENPEFEWKQQKNGSLWRYHASGRIMLQLTGIFFAFSLFVGILSLPFLAASQPLSAPSGLRKKVDEYVQIFTQNGLAGFFNRYEATGGLSEGRLGGVSSVRPDYQTDLTVTFVPFSTETLYLRAYVGQTYTGSSWDAPNSVTALNRRELGENYENFEKYTAFLEARRLAHYTENNPGYGISGKIRLKNEGANEGHLYLPYYSTEHISAPYNISDGIADGVFYLGDEYTVEYYPLLKNYWMINAQPDELLADLDPSSAEASYITRYDYLNASSYIDMPQETLAQLEDIKNEIGPAANLDHQIYAIQDYLAQNYSYSMTPGTTPRNADFAVHFLKNQDSGYCAHFATAATLLLRSFGIPARYVEGYAVPFTEVAEGTALDEPYEEWFSGKNPMGETGVVTVNVSDANAHAWVEVYKIGIGWVPYEFTPPDTDGGASDEAAYSDFWGIFSDLFGSTPPPDTVDNVTDTQKSASSFSKWLGKSSFMAKPLILFAGTLLLAICLFLLGRTFLYHDSLHRAYRKGNYAPLVAHRYRKLCRKLVRKKNLTGAFLLPSELADILTGLDNSPFNADETKLYMELLEQCCYSQQGISRDRAKNLLRFLKKCHKRIK